jgi:hypothetical protein
VVNGTVDLTAGYYNWNTPRAISRAILRMTIGTSQFTSDTFAVSSRTQTGVGFNCPDSFLLYWNKLPLVNNYRVYKLGSRYMEPIVITADSFLVLRKAAYPSLYYSVAPIIDGQEGVRSYTTNYTLQGVQCYFRSFLASLLNNTTKLELSLGTLYNIKQIVLEKFIGNAFKPVQQLSNINNLQVQFSDTDLTRGLNVYRIRLDLAGGGVVYSLAESVFHFKGSNYVVYPNPASQYQQINIAQQDVDVATMLVYNATGSKVFEKMIDDRVNKIPAGKLSKGFYFIRIINKLGGEETHKLAVY